MQGWQPHLKHIEFKRRTRQKKIHELESTVPAALTTRADLKVTTQVHMQPQLGKM